MTKNNDFGAQLKELEAITEWFESEDVDLNAALAKFERGMELADGLKKELQQVENRVDKIKAKFDQPVQAVVPPDDGDDAEPSLF